MEKLLVFGYFPGESNHKRAVALVRDSVDNPGTKEILAIAFSANTYIIVEWPHNYYAGFRDAEQLPLDDSVWDAATRYRDAKKGNSKSEEADAKKALDKLIGNHLTRKLHTAETV